MPFCCFEAFGGNSLRTFHFSPKKWLSQKGALKYSEFFFPYHVWKGANPEENLDLFKQLFLIKQVKGDKYLKKTVILHKLSHILLNYSFLLFWSNLGEIHRELFFLDIKVTISETITEKLRKFVFLTMFESGKSWGKSGFV